MKLESMVSQSESCVNGAVGRGEGGGKVIQKHLANECRERLGLGELE